jgi:drug/metabolite transporter (DMT)-like permease
MEISVGLCYLLAFGGVFIASCAQILLKKAADSKPVGFIKRYINLKVISAYFLMFVSTVTNVLAFKKIDLKFAQIFDATSIVWVTIFAALFFGEKPTLRRIVGIALVIVGSIVFCL